MANRVTNSQLKEPAKLYCGPGRVCKAASNAACQSIAKSHQYGKKFDTHDDNSSEEQNQSSNTVLAVPNNLGM